jgi:hypothetical protein
MDDGLRDYLGDLWNPGIKEAMNCFPLTNAKIPGRVGILRGAGNAIVPQVAAEFVAAYLETLKR